MRCRLLVALALLGAAGAATLARAEYVVIVVNLKAQQEGPKLQTPGLPGSVSPGPASAPGGSSPSYPPGGSSPSYPPGGNRGSTPPGGTYPGSMPGPGGRPGMGGPGMPGRMPGLPGFPGAPEDDNIDENPNLVVAVVELVESPDPKLRYNFEKGNPKVRTLVVKHRWGRTPLVLKNAVMETVFLKTASGRPLKSVGKQFQARWEELEKKFNPDEAIALARWALQTGLVADFEKVMDKLAQTEKTNRFVAAYQKIKEELAKPVKKDASSPALKNKLLDGYNTADLDNHHYVLLYQSAEAKERKELLDRLEKSFKSYYYWFAMRGINLPLPPSKLVAVLTDRGDDFRRLQKNVSSSPLLADSFATRREGILVFASKRGDEAYTHLDTWAKQFWDLGYVRKDLIKGKGVVGVPRGTTDEQQKQEARISALLLQAMEDEWEATGTSHEASRQLLFASKLLPTNVNVPEWVQFGAASFFETPLQSPFGGPGGANPYWLPRFKEYNDAKAKKYGPTPYDTLIGVVTDGYFRARPKPGETPEAVTRRARAAAWALTFYLTQPDRIEGLQKYFKELARMPRDIELDAKVLEAAFARAFDCVDPKTHLPDKTKLGNLATSWNRFVMAQTLEADAVHKTIREFYTKMNKSLAAPDPAAPSTQTNIFPSGFNPNRTTPPPKNPPSGGPNPGRLPGGGRRPPGQ